MGEIKYSKDEKKPGKTYVKYRGDAPEANREAPKPEPKKHEHKKAESKKAPKAPSAE